MNEKMERLLTILQDVNDEIDFAHERHMVAGADENHRSAGRSL